MDPAGAAIPSAEIKATQTDTGLVRTATSSTDGTYVLTNLPIGPYRLDVTKQGFKAYSQIGIVLQVATNPTVNVSLQLGAVSESIQVESNATLVETQTTSVGGLIENRRIVELPLNGRNPVELIQLTGAAIPGGANGTAGFPGGLNISVAGGLLSGVGYSLDGTMYNNLFDAVNLPFPFPDALQEFKVETSTMTAESGTHAAAAVSAVVKSGTNEYHGDLFEFLRNGDMNARNFKALRRDTLKRNQFGGTLGAPIMKNKLFYFVGYQGTRTRSDPADRTGFVPTAQMLAGDFSACPSYPATLKDPAGGTFPGKQIPVTRFSQQALNIVKLLPKSNSPCGDTPFGPVIQSNEYQVVGRMDYQLSAKQQIFGRYMATTFLQPPSFDLSHNLLDSASGGLDDLAQTFAIGHTYLISPTMVNAFRASVNRVGVHRFNDDYFSGCDVGVKMTCFVPHQTVINVSSGPAIGIGTAIQASFIPTDYTISDDVDIIHGSHQFAFGFSGFKYQHSQLANVNSAAAFGFTTIATGLGMTDFLLGQVGTFTQGVPNSTFTYKWGYGLYGQDTWKVSRRLTLNLGLRWEPFLPQGISNGAVYNFSWDNFNKGVKSTVFTNAPAGLIYAGDPGFQGKTGVNNRLDQFAPRIGVAYDPKGDGKMSIRASFGISYDFPNIQIMSTPTTAPPFGNFVTPPGPLNFADPWSTVAGGDPFTGTFSLARNTPFILNGNYVAQQPDAKAPTTDTWNLAVQRQFGNSWLVSISYLGSESSHVWVSRQLNPAVFGPGATTANTNQRRLANLINPTEGKYLSFVDQFESGGTSSYNGMIVTVQKRLNRGVSLNANYTWSHCIGDVTIASLVGGTGGTYTDVNNRRADRGNCQTGTLSGTQALDRRHIVNFTPLLEAPRFNDRILRAVASDWRLSTSYRFLSGAFQTASDGTDVALTGAAGQRPNQVLANPLCDHPNAACWINPNAFQIQASGTLGNAGRSNIPGPGFFQIDMALTRLFRVRERMNLELRGEAFNLTNSYRAGPVTTARNSAQFGQILTALDPRIMQVALKLAF
ncbi:MAG: TonB-dependent receptor [Acidobacteriia bacterium]|nr:TonB-dependent receptor [Terriglobia bacterium]